LHGILEVENQGTIEYAVVGAETKYLPNVRDYAGGIITGSHANFRNNLIDVKLLPFVNTRPIYGEQLDNLCAFSFSRFYTDHYLYDMQESPDTHVEFWEALGVHFYSCDFYNEYIPGEDEITLGDGIRSSDSKYYISSACVEYSQEPGVCIRYDTTRFQGLDYGIHSINTKSNFAPFVELIYFEKNTTGIYLSQVPQTSITLCKFNISKIIFDANENEVYTGIYLDEGFTGFQIEENIFKNTDNVPLSGSDSRIGIVFNNTSTEANEMYNNIFNDLNYGTLVLGVNRSQPSGETGLQIVCNDYKDCEYDICIANPNSQNGIGIAYWQGSNALDRRAPANNIFSYGWEHETSDYHNEGENIIYWHLKDTITANTKPKKITGFTISRQFNTQLNEEYVKDSCCPSNLETSSSIEELRTFMLETEIKIDSIENAINQIEDGGNTDELKNQVETSTPDDALILRNELLAESPNLSAAVMVSATNKENVLGKVMITEILSSNPQAAKSDTVQLSLNERINQLSNNQRAEIDKGWFTIGLKESLESQLSKYRNKRENAYNNVIRYYRLDTLSQKPADSIIMLMENGSNLRKEYSIAFEYFNANDSLNTMNTLNNITTEYNLTDEQVNQHELYDNYFEILFSLKRQNKNVLNADSSTIAGIISINNEATGRLKIFTRNILIILDSLQYNEPYYFANSNKNSKRRRFRKTENMQESIFSLYPNPAYDYIIVEYIIKKSYSEVCFQIIDINGLIHKQVNIQSDKNYSVIPINDLTNGLYICRFVVDNTLVSSQKFVVIR